MNKAMGTVTEDIKDKLDIVEVIKSYITVLPAGRNFKACCPFHGEKTPSFMISPDRRTWHCFGGCNEGGDVISFVMKYENVEFYDALKMLAERAGIDPSRLRGGSGEYRKFDALYAVNAAAQDFFVRSMTPETRAYALERGLTPETVAEFGVGYAPNMPDALVRELTKRGFSIQDICEAGVVFKTERGTYWDRFRDRLMFPLGNHAGKTVGFTGRTCPWSKSHSPDIVLAKYVNSPETPIFNKSKVLYGFDRAKSHIREAGTALVVEGQMDFLMTWQAGIKNVTATSGTALTDDHLSTLRRLAEKLLLCFDSDEAGQRAIERGIDMALTHDFSVGVVSLSGKDPADVAKEDPQALAAFVAAPCSARDFYFDRHLPAGSAASPDAVKKGVRAVLAKAKPLSPFEQATWLRELTLRTGMGESVLRAEMNRIEVPASSVVRQAPAESAVRMGRRDMIVARILALGGKAELADFPSEYMPAEGDPAAASVAELKAEWENTEILPEDRAKEIALLVTELRKEWRKERLSALKAAIVEAQATGDEARLEAAMREFDSLGRQLHTGG